MKKLSLAVLAIILLFATNITCLADDSETPNVGSSSEVETITIGEDITITYQTTVIDLNTGAEYHAKTGEPVVIEAVLGHQYSVSATASITPISGVLNAITHFSIGDNGLSINYDFNGSGVRTQAYTFIMPDGTQLTYVDKTLFSNCDTILSPSWKMHPAPKDLKLACMKADLSTTASFWRSPTAASRLHGIKNRFFWFLPVLLACSSAVS